MKKLLLSIMLLGGMISTQAALFQYSITFTDQGEANPSPNASGIGLAVYDDVAHTLRLTGTWTNLIGNVTQSHIHVSPTPFTGSGGIGVTSPSLPGFPIGATFGSYSNLLDMTLTSSYNATYLANNGGTTASAEAAFAAAMASGRAYWNIHSSFGPGGEIRGFLTVVPEPSALALFGLGALVMGLRSRKTSGQ